MFKYMRCAIRWLWFEACERPIARQQDDLASLTATLTDDFGQFTLTSAQGHHQ